MKVVKSKKLGAADGLPPWWVQAFSFLFLIFLGVPIIAVIQWNADAAEVTAFGLTLDRNDDPRAWVTGLSIVLFLGGVTGLSMLTMRKFAYDLGIVFCVSAMSIGVFGRWLNIGDADDQEWFFGGQLLMLACFLIHLLRHRRVWRCAFLEK